MFEDIFKKKTVDTDRLLQYGFVPNGDGFLYITAILNEQFRLYVTAAASGEVDTKLIELETGDEYVLYKTEAVGAFVGEVRSACEDVLLDIADKCYFTEVFRSRQTKALIDHVRAKYGDELEFLWKKFDDNAVWRRKDTGKWYAALLTVSRSKLGLRSPKMAEIIDLRCPPEQMQELLARDGYYPGWHMNKKHWFTIILDGSVSDERLFELVDISYGLAVK